MLSFHTDYNHKELMIKSNLKSSLLTGFILWIAMYASLVFEILSSYDRRPEAFVIGAFISFIIACMASVVLFVGLMISPHIEKWWEVSEQRRKIRNKSLQRDE